MQQKLGDLVWIKLWIADKGGGPSTEVPGTATSLFGGLSGTLREIKSLAGRCWWEREEKKGWRQRSMADRAVCRWVQEVPQI